MAGTKGTVFDQFIKSNDKKKGFGDLLNKYLKDVGDGLENKKLVGDITFKNLTSFVSDVKSGKLFADMQQEFAKGLDKFKELAGESLDALYGTAVGFAKNVLGDYIDALMSQVYIPEDVFLATVKTLEDKGSDPNYQNTLYTACLQRDLHKTFEWLDKYNNVTYVHTNTRAMMAGVTAGKYGSYHVCLYIMDKIKTARDAYDRIPIDTTNEKAVKEKQEVILKYNYYLHLIAKNVIMGAYDNFELSTMRDMFDKYGLIPSAFGKKDTRFGGRVKINMNDINRAAPIYNKGSIAILHERFKRSYKTTYIAPRNHNIKYMYIFMIEESRWGNDRLWHPELHQRLKSVIISTYLKALSDASKSLLTTGLGKYVQDPQNIIDILISETTKKAKPYLFDPKRQIYIRNEDTKTIPNVTEPITPDPDKNPDGSPVVDPNVIDGIDIRKFRVYTYEDLNGDTTISNGEFQTQVIDRIFTILTKGVYKRYDIFSTTYQARVYDKSGNFTGEYTRTKKDFYIFSTYDKDSSDKALSQSSFKMLVQKYLYDTYGRDRIPYITEMYPFLHYTEFLQTYDAHIASLSSGTVKTSAPAIKGSEWQSESAAATAVTNSIADYHIKLNKPRSETKLTDEEVAKMNEELLAFEAKLFDILAKLRGKLSTVKTPSSVKSSEVYALYKKMKEGMKLRNNGYITTNNTNKAIIDYKESVEDFVDLSGKRLAVNALSAIEDVEENISDGDIDTIDVSFVKTLSATIRDLVIKGDSLQTTADMPGRVESIINKLTDMVIDAPPDVDVNQLATMVSTLKGLSIQLNGNVRNMVSLTPSNVGIVNGKNKALKSLNLRAAKTAMVDYLRLFEGIPEVERMNALASQQELEALRLLIGGSVETSISELLQFITDPQMQSSIDAALSNYLAEQNGSYITTKNLIATNEATYDTNDQLTMDIVRDSLNQSMCDHTLIAMRTLFDAIKHQTLGLNENIFTAISYLDIGVLGGHFEKDNFSLFSDLRSIVRKGTANGQTPTNTILQKLEASKTDCINEFNTAAVNINAIVNGTTIGQLINSYTETIRNSINSYYTFTNAFVSANAATINDPSKDYEMYRLWEMNVYSLFGYTCDNIDTAIDGIRGVVQTTFTSSEMKEVVNSIRYTQNRIQSAIDSTFSDSANAIAVKDEIQTLTELIESLDSLASLLNRDQIGEVEEPEEPVDTSNSSGVLTPASVDPKDDFYMDSGFGHETKITGPLSDEDDEAYEKMLKSGGDIDIDDATVYAKMEAILNSNDSIVHRTFILGPAGLLNAG